MGLPERNRDVACGCTAGRLKSGPDPSPSATLDPASLIGLAGFLIFGESLREIWALPSMGLTPNASKALLACLDASSVPLALSQDARSS